MRKIANKSKPVGRRTCAFAQPPGIGGQLGFHSVEDDRRSTLGGLAGAEFLEPAVQAILRQGAGQRHPRTRGRVCMKGEPPSGMFHAERGSVWSREETAGVNWAACWQKVRHCGLKVFSVSESLLPSALVKVRREDLKAPRKEINTSDHGDRGLQACGGLRGRTGAFCGRVGGELRSHLVWPPGPGRCHPHLSVPWGVASSCPWGLSSGRHRNSRTT